MFLLPYTCTHLAAVRREIFCTGRKSSIKQIKYKEVNSLCSCVSTLSLNTSLHVCKWDYDGQGFEYQIVAGPAFTAIYTFTGIFISFAADVFNRKLLLAICLMFWSLMTLLTGFINSYWQLVILRFGLGMG